MLENTQKVNNIAALQNVGIILLAIKKAMTRPEYLPGLVVVHGPKRIWKNHGIQLCSC